MTLRCYKHGECLYGGNGKSYKNYQIRSLWFRWVADSELTMGIEGFETQNMSFSSKYE